MRHLNLQNLIKCAAWEVGINSYSSSLCTSVVVYYPQVYVVMNSEQSFLGSLCWNCHQLNPFQVVRAGFAATELGIREKLVVILLGQSSLMLALNASIGRHVPHLQLFADISHIDGDIATLPNLTPYRLNGQHSHIPVLSLIFNMVGCWISVMPYMYDSYIALRYHLSQDVTFSWL